MHRSGHARHAPAAALTAARRCGSAEKGASGGENNRFSVRPMTQKTPNSEKQKKLLEDYKLIPAQVTSNSINKENNFIVIDKGEAAGVRSEMGVVSGGGIVGIVFLTSKNYSLVMPILNKKSSISCRIRGHRFFGYLGWEGGSPLTAYLNDVPRYARFNVGDYVETSGHSSIFPPGLFVGRIIAIGNSRDGLSYRVKVNLATDFADLRDVCVISSPVKAEVDSLKMHALEMEQPQE